MLPSNMATSHGGPAHADPAPWALLTPSCRHQAHRVETLIHAGMVTGSAAKRLQLLPFELGEEAGTGHDPLHMPGHLAQCLGMRGGTAKPQAARKTWKHPLAEAKLERRSNSEQRTEGNGLRAGTEWRECGKGHGDFPRTLPGVTSCPRQAPCSNCLPQNHAVIRGWVKAEKGPQDLPESTEETKGPRRTHVPTFPPPHPI